MITVPRHQITSIGQRLLPHCTLRLATVAGARKSIAQTPRLEGFHKCLPRSRIAYFDVMEITLHSAYGQNAGERISIPTLIPDT